MSLRRRSVPLLAALLVCLAVPLRADHHIDRLFNAMQLEKLVGLMRDEGLAHGEDLAVDMVPGGPDAAWRALIGRIYDTEKMTRVVRTEFTDAFGNADTAPLLDFFQSDAGRALVEAELETRAAFMTPEIEDAARDAWRNADTSTPRQRLITEYVEVNNLLDYNLAGALNSSYQFFVGMVEGGALDMTEEQILADVWRKEAETRADTREWLYGYLTMAYGDLPRETLADYVALSRTPPGQALNRALFAGFDRMYAQQSLSLGLALATRMARGEDL